MLRRDLKITLPVRWMLKALPRLRKQIGFNQRNYICSLIMFTYIKIHLHLNKSSKFLIISFSSDLLFKECLAITLKLCYLHTIMYYKSRLDIKELMMISRNTLKETKQNIHISLNNPLLNQSISILNLMFISLSPGSFPFFKTGN